eukprot:CAMPEP_0171120996 /NCGR_PEP_ID=MMETSP0766_2-20121228/101216_1 /TAXON_ID=439317 /ORGANISM="Gambierdiscus australes, Strain CAWD 149" /LENGTH=30 /DNA_ID= /DNA_START= /DNA_END= /DNA_ORIENTATION=
MRQFRKTKPADSVSRAAVARGNAQTQEHVR